MQGPLNTAILEHQKGFAIVAVLADETLLLVLVRPSRRSSANCSSSCAGTASTSRRWSDRDRIDSRLCHVLVADDEPHIGRIIKMKLEQGPFRVTLAYDGREALDVLERERAVGLVLLDLMMPNLSGLDVLRRDPRAGRSRRCPASSSPPAGTGSSSSDALELGATRVPDQAVQSQETLRARRASRGSADEAERSAT